MHQLALNHCLLILFSKSVLTDPQLDTKYAGSAFKDAGSSVHVFPLEFFPEGDSLAKALKLFLYYLFHLHRPHFHLQGYKNDPLAGASLL